MMLLLVLFLFSSLPSPSSEATLKDYIVHVQPPSMNRDLQEYYHSFLQNTVAYTDETRRIIHTYFHAMSGFAAQLTESEVNEMAKEEGFLKAQPSRLLRMQTTHTPEFLGLQQGSGLWNSSEMGKGIIIGMMDSGILPMHESFNDKDMPAPPSKWKGTCKDLKQVEGRCNKKLIGVRDLTERHDKKKTVIDYSGHGIHTASIAAGNFVNNANVLGNGNGTASGMAPLAHLAVYKVCGDTFCKEIDLIAGIDAAIGDGVDVLSISIAGSSKPFYENAFDIATFKAAREGIFVSCSAGNQGPAESTISNRAPWYLTVAAGTMDRSIKAVVKLGDGQEFEGQTIFNQDKFPSTSLPLTFPIPFGIGAEETDNCNDDLKTLNPKDIVKKGEMVLCNALGSPPLGKYVQKLGGTAMILLNGETLGYTTFAEYRVLPASQVSYADASKIFSYFNSSNKPTAAIIFKGTIIGKSTEAPTVAYFSSRGPSKQTPDVLKPDILGPGVNVLGAWIKPVGHDEKGSNVPYMKYFNFLSGTSMAAPHLSGIAALIKQKHPDWSPAAIKSAIMTTASTEDNNGSPIMDEQHHPASFFMMGAGHVNPQKAADPGLVFDIETEQYIAFLCGLGYNDKQVQIITGDMNTKCEDIQKISQSELNYPSIVLSSGKLTPPVIVNRTVTNVGEAMSTYQVEINMPNEVIVEVVPNVLKFHELNEKQSYQVSINSSNVVVSKKIMQGNLKWVSDKYTVTTPIIIY